MPETALNKLRCSRCKAESVPGPEPVAPCECGGQWELAASDTNASPTDFFRGVARENGKKIATLAGGLSESADGTFATIQQTVYLKEKRYKKKVTLADGTVVKDVEGSLEDKNLHGSQKK